MLCSGRIADISSPQAHAAGGAAPENTYEDIEYPAHPAKPAEWVEELDGLVAEEAAAPDGDGRIAQLLAASEQVKALRAAVEAEKASASDAKADKELPPAPCSSIPDESMSGGFAPRSTAETEAAADSDDSSANTTSNNGDDSFATQGFSSNAGDDSDAATSVADAAEKSTEPVAQVEAVVDAEVSCSVFSEAAS